MSITPLRPKSAEADKEAPRSLRDLEGQIRDLERAAHVAFLMTMHDQDEGTEPPLESLGLFAVQQVERLATELRRDFYKIGYPESDCGEK